MNWWPFGTNEESVKKQAVSSDFETEDFDETAKQEVRKEEIEETKKKVDLEVAFIKINDLEKRLNDLEFENKEKFELLAKEKEEEEKLLNDSLSKLVALVKDSKGKIEKLENDRDQLIKTNKNLVNSFQEMLSLLDENDKDSKYDKMKERRTKDLEVINKNFTYVRKLLKDSDDKYKALVEIFSERVVEDEKMPDLLSTNVSLRKVLQMKNDNKALLFSIAYMFKKYFDVKGIRL